ncbi:hypothetical protein [Pseudonocardia lacus]|uniref:hypothetical protein n=1 Tax=Pseudonocardia lacus TaxID=2835865 RepID=UPI001BDD6A74|nr:hypothetical protein [Pseudonocardia lacus]
MIVEDVERGGGAVSVPMAVAVLAMILAIGLAVDGVRAAQGLAHADAVAEEAARAAGQALDTAALIGGVAAVEPAQAAAAARSYLDAAQATGTVTVTAPDTIRVEVTLTRPTILLGLIGQDQITSRGSAEAILVPTVPGAGP